jgi:hypothetical protein
MQVRHYRDLIWMVVILAIAGLFGLRHNEAPSEVTPSPGATAASAVPTPALRSNFVWHLPYKIEHVALRGEIGDISRRLGRPIEHIAIVFDGTSMPNVSTIRVGDPESDPVVAYAARSRFANHIWGKTLWQGNRLILRAGDPVAMVKKAMGQPDYVLGGGGTLLAWVYLKGELIVDLEDDRVHSIRAYTTDQRPESVVFQGPYETPLLAPKQ